MKTKLMVTLFMLIAGSVSYAQDYDDDIEVVEKNVARDSDSDTNQEEYSKSKMDAYDTKNSPQINIYNANSNANKQAQKARQQAEAEALADAEADADALSESKSRAKNDNSSEFGAEYIARANDMRKDRKDMEVGTEQKMIEKIEYSRMEDEKDRANRLFGNRLNKQYDNDYNDNEYKKPQVIVVEKKPEYVAPAPQTAVYETKATEPVSNWWGQESYIAPMIGVMNYSASNVRADTAIGVGFGNRFDSNVSFEGSFLYSTLEMDDYTMVAGEDDNYNNLPGLKDVNQYGIGAGVKYNFNTGRVSPFVGALLGYTWRDYTETRGTGDATDSSAIDAGLNIGADVKLAKNFSIGAEYRWMKNVWYDRTEPDTSNVESDFPELDASNLEPLEEAGYSAFLVNGKFTF